MSLSTIAAIALQNPEVRKGLVQEVLEQTGLSPEEAVVEIAEQLGVPVQQVESFPEVATAEPIRNGEKVDTEFGAAQAAVLTPEDFAVLKQSASILTRLFG